MKPEQFPIKTLTFLSFFGFRSVQAARSVGADLLDFEARRLGADETVNLKQAHGGKVVLVIDTASKCASTGQYEGLEALCAKYRERGLVVLGFPSNDFGGQEPGTEIQIKDFCQLTYSVKFPMFAKTTVKKGEADPFFRSLAESAGRYPKWNFRKDLLDRRGRMVDNFQSWTSPQSAAITEAIEKLL
jgi:glutathione peroxidase